MVACFGRAQDDRFTEQMRQLEEAHRILREKLEASQQRQMMQLLFYYDQIEMSLLSSQHSPIGSPMSASASRASTMGRAATSSLNASLRKL